MLKRIIPCLDVKDGRTVKGVNFVGLRDVGDAVELGEMYARQGADELVYLDISATVEGRGTFVNLVQRISERINIPFTVGGGISSLDDAARLLDAGADTIVLGCTHYPFLEKTIRKVAGECVPEREINIIDPAPAVARHLVEVMAEEGISMAVSSGFSLQLHTSGDPDDLKGKYLRLL